MRSVAELSNVTASKRGPGFDSPPWSLTQPMLRLLPEAILLHLLETSGLHICWPGTLTRFELGPNEYKCSYPDSKVFCHIYQGDKRIPIVQSLIRLTAGFSFVSTKKDLRKTTNWIFWDYDWTNLWYATQSVLVCYCPSTGRKEVQSNRESKSKFNFNMIRPLDHHLVPLFIEKYRKLPPMNLGCAQVFLLYSIPLNRSIAPLHHF